MKIMGKIELTKVNRICNLVRSDCWLTVIMIREELSLTRITVHHILTNELGMKKICTKIVSKTFCKTRGISRGKDGLAFCNRLEMIPSFWNALLLVSSLVPAVHSHWGNPRQGESENVDGNTRLALDPLV